MFSSRSIKNIGFGLFYQLIVFAFGLITPRLLLVNYGSEINGMLSSIHQLFIYLSLLEAGVGAASLQALYKTVGCNDYSGTNRILSATNFFYKKTSCFYFFCIVILSISYPIIVKTNIPPYICISVIILTGFSSVINYLYLAKYRILLQAEGKSYIFINLGIGVYIISNFAKIFILNYGYNIIYVQASYLLINLFPCVFICFYLHKNYKWINLKEIANFEAISQKKNVLVHQFSNLIFDHTDVIILTVVCGLKVVSVYSLFSGLYSSLKSVLFSFLDGIKFILGQLYNKNIKLFLDLYDVFELYYMSLTFAAYTTLQVIIISFLQIYTKDVYDISYTNTYLSYLFTSIYLIVGARGPVSLVIYFAGHFKETQHQSIIEMIINLTVTIICIFYFGIYGALIGTIIALIYRTIAVIIYVNKNILKRPILKTTKRWLMNVVISIVIISLMKKNSHSLNTYMDILKYGSILAIINLIIFGSISSFSEINTFKIALRLINQNNRKNILT